MRRVVSVVVLAFLASACTPPPPTAGQLNALTVLGGIPIAAENGAGYNRALFHYPADPDHDHCDTRAEVLTAVKS